MLSNFDIIAICKKLKINLLGVYSNDLFNDVTLENGFYVINLQNSNDGNGTHWTCVGVRNFDHIYFDSYGFIAPQSVQDKLNDFYFWNDSQIQHLDSITCGWFVIAFMYYMQNNKEQKINIRYKNFIDLFDKKNLLKNDDILYEFIKLIIK